MANELLLAAADELDRAADAPVGGAADAVVAMEMAALAARVRQAARWLDRQPAKPCSCHLQPTAAPQPREKQRSLGNAEAAELLGVSVRTVERMAKAGELHPMKRGRVVRYDRAELELYLQAGRTLEGTANA